MVSRFSRLWGGFSWSLVGHSLARDIDTASLRYGRLSGFSCHHDSTAAGIQHSFPAKLKFFCGSLRRLFGHAGEDEGSAFAAHFLIRRDRQYWLLVLICLAFSDRSLSVFGALDKH